MSDTLPKVVAAFIIGIALTGGMLFLLGQPTTHAATSTPNPPPPTVNNTTAPPPTHCSHGGWGQTWTEPCKQHGVVRHYCKSKRMP